MPSGPRHLFRKVLADTGDPVAAIRAVREVFGLSLAEAKVVWTESIGRAEALTDQQEVTAAAELRVVCPRCLSPERVARKLHALPAAVAQVDAPASANSRFANGFWCSACEVAFIPDHYLREMGLAGYRLV